MFSSHQKGSIRGTVKNSEGIKLPAVTVTAAGKTTTTNNDGQYTLDGLPEGTQKITASLSGYFDDGRGYASVKVVADTTVTADDLILVPASNNEVLIWHLRPTSSSYVAPRCKQIGGTIYFDSLFTDWQGVTEPATAIYSLGRRYARFKATVGIADYEPDDDSRVIFKVIGDGATLYQSDPLKVDSTGNVDVDVSNVLTLELQVFRVDSSNSPDVVWGNARLTKTGS